LRTVVTPVQTPQSMKVWKIQMPFEMQRVSFGAFLFRKSLD
jgi:hypothetical protein